MITIQMHHDFQWVDAFTVDFCDQSQGFRGRCLAGYVSDHVLSFIDYPSSSLAGAVSSEVPLDWGMSLLQQAPSFLYDVVPSGFGRRALSSCEAAPMTRNVHAEVFFLSRHANSPIGNLRVKESCDRFVERESKPFSRGEISALGSKFKRDLGRTAEDLMGGFGAGGEAPKILVVQGSGGDFYPESSLHDSQALSHHLVKYPRNRAGASDQRILRSEYHYYRALHSLGIETVAADGLDLVEGEVLALWMSRFDREVTPDGVRRHSMESVYSMMGVMTPGSYLNHTDIFRRLAKLWRSVDQADNLMDLAQQYVMRDLLNVVLGNADNHGRNTSIMREPGRVKLAPIYDLAPMVMDDEGVTRLTRWSRDTEVGAVIDWRKACASLGDWIDSDYLYDWLRAECRTLLPLPDLLADTGLPAQTMAHPGVWVARLPRYFEMTGLS